MKGPGKKTILSWSDGKDGALALYEIQRAGDYEIVALLTTITKTPNQPDAPPGSSPEAHTG